MVRPLISGMICALALGSALAVPAHADESMVKKTLDGRCLASTHKDYWETKVYVAKPSMAACVKSGGKAAK